MRKGLEVAFAPGFDVPDAFVEDVDRMTYSSYHDSPEGSDDYSKEEGLANRMKATGKPLLVMMGAEEQILEDPAARLAEYRAIVPGVETKLIPAPATPPTSRNRPRRRRWCLASTSPSGTNCKNACRIAKSSGSVRRFEPMFDTKKTSPAAWPTQ